MSGEPNTALDQLEAQLFREARQELKPDEARVDSLWQSVAAASTLGAAISGVSWATPPSMNEGPVPSPPAPLTSSGVLSSSGLLAKSSKASFGLRALALSAVGGALLGFAAGYGAGGARNAHEPPRAAVMVSSKANSAVGTPSQVTDAADAPVAPDEPQAPAALPENSAKPRAPSSSKPGASEPGPSQHSAESGKPSFYEELQYLKRAQSALRQGNGALALGLMTELDSIQPGGALLSERGVTQVLAHCQIGDVASAERVARRLTAQGLASVYTERLENSCAGAVLPQR